MELKCVERLANQHTAQCLNDLRASGLGLCLPVNFQNPKVEGKRIIQGFHAPDRIGDAPSRCGRTGLPSYFGDTTLWVLFHLVAEMHSGQCSRSTHLENASNLRKSG